MKSLAKYILPLFVVWPQAFAQVKEVRTEINTIGPAKEIRILLVFEAPEGYAIDDENPVEGPIGFELRAHDSGLPLTGDPRVRHELGSRSYALEFKVSGLSKELINSLATGETRYYLHVTDTLKANFKHEAGTRISVILPPSVIRQATSRNRVLTEEHAQMIIEASGGEMHLYTNKIDLGKKVAVHDSTKTAYVVSFALAQPFVASGNVFHMKGTIGTESDDPLNMVSLFPISLSQSYEFPAVSYPSQIMAQVGFEGTQSFDRTRMNLNFSSQSIIPNLIDLTYGEDRLRLKPILKFGAKGLFDLKDTQGAKENRLELFSEFYYYIPVMKTYAMLIEGLFFWIDDGSKKVRKQIDVTFGVEIPGSGLKAMAKYTTGENDISFQKDSKLILGLLLDIFEKSQ